MIGRRGLRFFQGWNLRLQGSVLLQILLPVILQTLVQLHPADQLMISPFFLSKQCALGLYTNTCMTTSDTESILKAVMGKLLLELNISWVQL